VTTLDKKSQQAANRQRLVFPPPTPRGGRAALRRVVGGLGGSVRGVALPVGANQSVQCPQKGEIPVDMCADCPLLISLKSRGGTTRVLCCVPREAFSATLNPSDRYLSGRMGFR
jgi:hypothetical protein